MLTNPRHSTKILSGFLIAWFIINIIQGAVMGLHEDEAYYWMYSRFPDIGYFDHPPMIALYINAGYSLFANVLGVRLFSVISSTVSIWLLWQIIKHYSSRIDLFILLFTSFLFFNIYGFMATPDAPLFFFSILFLYSYRLYLKNDRYTTVFLMIIACTGLLYSKYHGILLILFTIASDISLFKRRSFWIILIIVLLLFLPHIWWQAQHNYPSVSFHLYDRSPKAYRVSFTTEYLLSQLLILAPLAGWYFVSTGIKASPIDKFTRALKYIFYGIFIFFLVSTLKGRVEAHWTLIGSISLFLLCCIYYSRSKIPRWAKTLIIINSTLIFAGRFLFLFPGLHNQLTEKTAIFNGEHAWINRLKEIAGEHYVVFNKGFQEPAKYNFYNGFTKGFSYNSRIYRKNQFDIWPIEDSLREKDIYYMTDSQTVSQSDSFDINKKIFYGRWLKKVRIYQKVDIMPGNRSYSVAPGKMIQIHLLINNPYKDTINFDNNNASWKCFFEYVFLQKGSIIQTGMIDNPEGNIPPGEKKYFTAGILAPTIPGSYQMYISIRTEPFPGTRNSKMIEFKVK